MSAEKNFFVYMTASGFYGTLYVGVTSNLPKRIWEHKEADHTGFTKQHNVKNLVWYQPCPNAEAAIKLEKRLKKYKRDWKINLIERDNPEWNDLYEIICR